MRHFLMVFRHCVFHNQTNKPHLEENKKLFSPRNFRVLSNAQISKKINTPCCLKNLEIRVAWNSLQFSDYDAYGGVRLLLQCVNVTTRVILVRQSRHDHNAYRGLETFAIRLFWPQKCCLSGQSISVDLNSSQEEHVVI